MEVSIDLEASAAYISLRPGKVRTTENLGDGYFLDYGEDDEVIGIEVLQLEQGNGLVTVSVPDEIWNRATQPPNEKAPP